MVRKIRAALAISLSFAGIMRLTPAVRAQGVLEQMETEVAAIAAKTKSAVVTISDDSPLHDQVVASGYNYRVEPVYETPEQAKKRIAADTAAIRELGVTYFNLDYAETGARGGQGDRLRHLSRAARSVSGRSRVARRADRGTRLRSCRYVDRSRHASGDREPRCRRIDRLPPS